MLYLHKKSQQNDQIVRYCSFFSCQKTLDRLIVPLIKDCAFSCKAIIVTGQQHMGCRKKKWLSGEHEAGGSV